VGAGVLPVAEFPFRDTQGGEGGGTQATVRGTGIGAETDQKGLGGVFGAAITKRVPEYGARGHDVLVAAGTVPLAGRGGEDGVCRREAVGREGGQEQTEGKQPDMHADSHVGIADCMHSRLPGF